MFLSAHFFFVFSFSAPDAAFSCLRFAGAVQILKRRKKKNMKKLLAIVLAFTMIFALCAVSASAEEPMKVGLIALHDENSPYDNNFIVAFNAACEACGVTPLVKTGVPESAEAYDAAAELADEGCAIVFADSYGHQDYILEAAQEFPEVQFTSCTGDRALAEGVENYHNAFANIFMGRYLAGVAAGMKLNEMIENGEFTAEEAKVGYVGAKPYAEVISGYTSWFLGVRYMCPTATMEVIYTNSWYDETLEKEAANNLIKNGCKLISEHADSMGAPTACETAGVPNASYNLSFQDSCPNTYLIASRINWRPYFRVMVQARLDGTAIPTDWSGAMDNNAVEVMDINETVAAPGTAEKIAELQAKILSGELNIFDTTTFTVTNDDEGANLFNNGSSVATVDANGVLTGYLADVYNDGTYTGETNAIDGGKFVESQFRSAPYFYAIIDGITILG